MRWLATIGLGMVVLPFSGAASYAQFYDVSPGDYSVTKLHIDQVMQPKNVLDVMKECKNNAVCSAVATAASSLTGVPLDTAVAVAATVAPQRAGEGWHSTVTLPEPYVYCNVQMSMVSIVPHDGPRGSLWLGEVRGPREFYLEAWTPRRGLGNGRSWVEADVTIIGVKPSLQNFGNCHDSNKRTIWYCRGGGCEGKPITDTGQAVSTAHPPGASSRN